MSISSKEIYNYSQKQEQWQEVRDFCREDVPESVKRFQNFHKSGTGEAFLNGYDAGRNILMCAADNANVSLLSYIAENAEASTLDMLDSEGHSALYHVVQSRGPEEKVISCVRILLEAGADVNAAGDVEEREDALGYVVRIYGFLGKTGAYSAGEQEKLKTLMDLFLAYGVEGGCSRAWDRKENQYIGRFSVNDESEDWDLKNEHISVLEQAQERVDRQYWSKARLLMLGASEQSSPLSQVPTELRKLLIRKIWSS